MPDSDEEPTPMPILNIAPTPPRPQDVIDTCLDEALEETFPASDPPGDGRIEGFDVDQRQGSA